MGLAAMIRRLRQQDALDLKDETIATYSKQLGEQDFSIKLRDIALEDAKDRISELEAEILRLRKNALTPTPERVDNSVVKAKSTADVRRITEAAFGRELLKQEEEVHGE
jgi:hypothetical protein